MNPNLVTRRNILYLLIAITAILSFVLLLVFLNRPKMGWITVTAPSKTPGNATIEVRMEAEDDVAGEEIRTLTLKAKESQRIKVRQSTWRVTGTTGNLKAIDIVKISDKETKLTTPLAEQRSLVQLGSDAYGCPVVVNGTAFSYNCRGDGFITRHTPGELGASVNTALFDEQYFGALQIVKNGLMGMKSISDEEQVIEYIDLATTTTMTIPLPTEVTALFRKELPRIVTANRTGDSRFALFFDKSNKVYLFKDVTDTAPVLVGALGKSLKLGTDHRFTMGSFGESRFTIFSGPLGEEHEGEGTFGDNIPEPSDEPLPAYAFEYDMDGKLQRTLNISSETEIDAFYTLTGDYYVADSPGGGLSFYHRSGTTLSLVYDAGNIASWAVHEDKAYFLVDGVLYQLTPKEAGLFSLHSLYSSSTVKASEVFSTSSGIVFTGVVGTVVGAPLGIFQLTDKLEATTLPNPAVTPEPATETVIEPALIGLDQLNERGLTSRQGILLQEQLNKYVVTLSRAVEKITINNVSVAPRTPDQGDLTTMYFSVKFSGSDAAYRGQIDQIGLRTLHLWLYDGNNQLAYDSGVVTYDQ